MAKFQMINSKTPNTIAEVLAEGDIDGFRQNPEWYELMVEEKEEKEDNVKKVPIKKTLIKET